MPTLEIIGAETLRTAFESMEKLRIIAKSETAPRNAQEAMEWVQSAPDTKSRAARKTLSYGMIYGIGPQRLKSVLDKFPN
jgi:hypothetical protein